MIKDLTRGSPLKLILQFTLPLLIGNVFQQFYNMADTIIVGRTIGVNALAAVGVSGSIMFLLLGFVQGLTSGFAVVTAQRFGASDPDDVRKSVTTSLVLSAGFALALTLVGVSMARPILELMNTPAEIIDDAYNYIVVIFGGIGASVLFNMISSIIRAVGDSKTPLIFLIGACLLNIGLDFLFILTFHMGTAGAAVATVIAQLVSGVLCLIYMFKKFPVLHITRRDWQLTRRSVWTHLRVGFPMGFQCSIVAIGAMILQSTLNMLGPEPIAAYTAAQKIETIGVEVMMSFGITMTTYAAQNYGAGKIDRIRIGVRQCALVTVLISVGISVLFITAGTPMTELFVGPDQLRVTELAQVYLVITSCSYAFLALLCVFRYTIQGLGKSTVPTLAGIVELVMRVFAAVVLAERIGFIGICISNPIAWAGAAVLLFVAYLRIMKKLTVPHQPQRHGSMV